MLTLMRIEFLKMQGLGNDFFVFDAPAVSSAYRFDPGKVRSLADRHTGVGFDQALMLESPSDSNSRVFYRIFNSDGSEVEQCGNGARCIAALLYARAPQLGREIKMQSIGGIVHARVREDGLVSVDMGVPNFDPRSLPMDADAEAAAYTLDAGGESIEFGAVSIGNPHAVLRVTDVAAAPVARLGPAIERHRRFPRGVNVGFMQIVDPGHIRLRVFERGAGETQACGTGACAVCVAGALTGRTERSITAHLPGGDLQLEWRDGDNNVYMTGPAVEVFSGQWPDALSTASGR